MQIGHPAILKCLHNKSVIWIFKDKLKNVSENSHASHLLYWKSVSRKHEGTFYCYTYYNNIIGNQLGYGEIKVIGEYEAFIDITRNIL